MSARSRATWSLSLFGWLLLISPLRAATCTLPATKTTLAATAGTWTGSGCPSIPGAGDSGIIADGAMLTIASGETWDIGSTPATHGVSAVHFSATGAVLVASGGSLKVRGPLTYTGMPGQNTDYLTLQPGSTLLAVTASGARYTTGSTGIFSWRPIHAIGTANARITITIDHSAGGAWQFGDADLASLMGMPGVFDYVDLTGIGNASTPGFFLASGYDTGDGVAGTTFTFNHSTCADCAGAVGGTFGSPYVLQMNFSAWTRTQTNYCWLVSTTGGASGQIHNSVFDKSLFGDTNQSSSPGGMVLSNVIVGDAFSPLYDPAGSYSITSLAVIAGGSAINNVFPHGATGLYWFPLHAINNPHVLTVYPNNEAPTLTNVIFDSYGDTVADSGELFGTGATPGSPTTYTLFGAIEVPSSTGKGYAEWGTLFSGTANTLLRVLHSSGYGGGAINFLQLDEGGASPGTSGWIQRAGLMWSASASPAWYKALTQSEGAPSTDLVDSDYNLGWNFTATKASCSNCTNQGNGYVSKFSAPNPGGHDLNVNPYLANPHVSLALWDTRYLKNSYPVWSSSHAGASKYVFGDLVQYVNAGLYRGQPIGLRCINVSEGCDGRIVPVDKFTFSSGLISIVVSANVATVTMSGLGSFIHIGDVVYCTASGNGLCPDGRIVVTGVSGVTFTYTTTAADGTYGVGNDPNLTIEVWQAFWEFSSVYRLRAAVLAGTTYTDGATGCNSCSAIEALIAWIRRSNTPQNPALRGVAYPGDPSSITNVGAAQMDTPLAFAPITQ